MKYYSLDKRQFQHSDKEPLNSFSSSIAINNSNSLAISETPVISFDNFNKEYYQKVSIQTDPSFSSVDKKLPFSSSSATEKFSLGNSTINVADFKNLMGLKNSNSNGCGENKNQQNLGQNEQNIEQNFPDFMTENEPDLKHENDLNFPYLKTYKSNRNLKYSIRFQLSKRNLVTNRTKMCGCILKNVSEVFLEKDSTANAKLKNIMHCGSIWQCDVCSAKILQGRQKEIELINLNHIKSGGGISLVTFTAKHSSLDKLNNLLGSSKKKTGISGAFRRLRQDEAWRKIQKKYGILFDCRALETTYGHNGFHVHIHSLFYTENTLSKIDSKNLEADLYKLWRRVSLKAGLKSPDKKHAVDVRDGSDAGKYVTKWGSPNELTSNIKMAKNGNYTIWQLKTYLVNPELSPLPIIRVEAILKEYFQAFFGKKLLTWSDPDGFKKKYLAQEKTDEEILKDTNIESIIIASIGKYAYNQLRYLNKVADTISVFELKGFDGLFYYLKSLNIDMSQVNFIDDNSMTDEDINKKKNYFLSEFGFFPACKNNSEYLKYSVLNYHKLFDIAMNFDSSINFDIAMNDETNFSYQKYGRFNSYIKDFCYQFNQNLYANSE